MNLRHWHIFLAIAKNGSFSKTAEAVGIRQPGLSRIVKELEASLGAVLFERFPRGLRLTTAGEQFRRRATELLAEIDELGRQINATDDGLAGSCALGMPPFLSAVLTVPLVLQCAAAHPRIRLHLWEFAAERVRDAIVSRHLDIGVVAYPMSDPDLFTSPLLTEEICLVGPANAGLSADRPVALEDVSRYPLIISGRTNAFRRRVESAVERKGGQLTVGLEVDGVISEYVRRGCGFGVVPWSALQSRAFSGDISMAPIQGLTITWATVRRREALSRCADQVLQAIVECASGRIRAGEWRAQIAAAE